MDETDSLFELGEISSSINLDAMEPLSGTSSAKVIDVRDLGPLSKHERNRILAMGE